MFLSELSYVHVDRLSSHSGNPEFEVCMCESMGVEVASSLLDCVEPFALHCAPEPITVFLNLPRHTCRARVRSYKRWGSFVLSQAKPVVWRSSEGRVSYLISDFLLYP